MLEIGRPDVRNPAEGGVSVCCVVGWQAVFIRINTPYPMGSGRLSFWIGQFLRGDHGWLAASMMFIRINNSGAGLGGRVYTYKHLLGLPMRGDVRVAARA